ncbi:MAG: peptide chain release factor 1 [Candidatus Riflebacteria bacterium]|nr:peptide chain release factor 1 [Candidatus Riflebacteria bacterium]
MLDNRVTEKLNEVSSRFDKIEESLGSPEVAGDPQKYQKLAKQRAELEAIIVLYRDYKKSVVELADAEEMVQTGSDRDLKELAEDEVKALKQRLLDLANKLKLALIPKDPLDKKNILVEIRAGAGGDEAGLFAGDVCRMYTRYAERRRWKIEMLESSTTGVGGFKQVIFSVQCEGAYGRMKYESGVHRVQRIPVTEASGRIHTSTITVAVLPEAEEVDVQIRPEDLKIDVFRSSGPGGQSVNTTDSAVRVTHLPTGMVVSCQDEKSQLKNKAKALRVLRARLLDIEKAKQDAERAQTRKSQVGTGDRSERIRTYNFPQGRLTDHRINLTIYRLTGVLEGELDEVLDALQMADQESRLTEI